MKFRAILVILLSATFLLNAMCKKDRPDPPAVLPPITQFGANTFGCKVDGDVWVPYYKCGGSGNPCGEISVDVRSLNTQNKLPVQIDLNIGRRTKDNSQSFFQINTLNNTGIFTVGEKIDSIEFKYVKPGSLEYFESPGRNSTRHFLITNLDTINKVISGTFEATLYRSITDSVKITEGRFDLKFQVCKCSN